MESLDRPGQVPFPRKSSKNIIVDEINDDKEVIRISKHNK